MAKKEMHHNAHMIVVLGVVLLVILSIVTLVQINDVKKTLSTLTGADVKEADNAAAPTQPSAPSANNVDMKTLIDDDDVKGDPNAPVTIVEWSDFECPFCARFYTETLGQIQTNYIDTGKVKLVYRDFPLSFHQNAQKAAEAAECAGEQGKYWDMHDKLFEDGVTGGVTAFKQYAADLGLNTANFNSCLDSGQMTSEVQQDMRDGSNAGIRGTPGFIINGQLVSGAQPYAAFEQAIEKALAAN
ncbi:MAG: thioredoxin domain-containing protein [archaeon]